MSSLPPSPSADLPDQPIESGLSSGAKYWAFISYSHRDARVAARLQRALETYRLPRRVVRATTAHGPVPRFLKPVFRDRDELQATTDLKAAVGSALAQSRFLIVVCSPDAARSAWVNQEILEFKRLHGETRVLALVARGEPFASAKPGRGDEECFPPALRARVTASGVPDGEPLEPIAADMRRHADGWRRATLKIIAGMIGVGVDALIQRDTARRARRLAYVAIASLAGMAAMGALAISAIRARDEAQRQHAQAEDLLEFMLGDLRKRLDAVGRLDVLDSVGNKALAYYAQLDPELLDANSLGRRARALHLLGEMREQAGRLEAAQLAFQRAAETTAQLLAQSPRDPQRLFDHAQSVYWVGHLARMRGEAHTTEERFREYMRLADRLVETDRGNLKWQMEAAYARGNVAVALLDTSRPAEALPLLNEQRDIRKRLVAANPAQGFDLANTYGWIAKAHEMQGHFADAVAAQIDKRRVLEGVPNGATDRQVQRAFGTIDNDLARLHLMLGAGADAHASARAAVDVFAALVRQDPKNKVWLEQLCLAQVGLADALLAVGERGRAREVVQSAAVGLDQLLTIDPKVANWQVRILGLVLQLRARTAEPTEGPRIIADLGGYLARVKDFATGDRALPQARDAVVAAAELQLGLLYARNGAAGEAAAHWHAVVARLERYGSTEDFSLLTTLATARCLLGDTAVARASVARMATTSFRHPAFAELQQMLSIGAGSMAAETRK